MPKCQKCGGQGFILKDIDGNIIDRTKIDFNFKKETIAHACECRLQKDREIFFDKQLIEANIEKRFSEYTFQDYLNVSFSNEIKEQNESNRNTLQNFINNPNEFMKSSQVLWIWGKDPNAGHTTLACMLGISLIKAGQKVRFFRMQGLLDAFTDFDKKSAYFEDLKKFNIYIVDDAFVADRSFISGKYTKAHLFNFIDTALGEDKHFIMTSDKLVTDMGIEFGQISVILQRSLLELELRGSIIETKQHTRDNVSRADEIVNNMKRK